MKQYNQNSQYNFYYFGRSRSRSCWLDYLEKNKSKYFEKYHPNIIDKKCVIIIGAWYFGPFYNNVSEVFEKMLDVFQEKFHEEYFLFKPHPLSDISYVKKEFEKRNLNYEITYLHPNLLAMKAVAFIGNNFSNMMTDGYLLNVPIIEFSHYIDELLKITGGKSTSKKYVDYFIDNDVSEFNNILHDVISKSNDVDNNLKDAKVDEAGSVAVINLLLA